MKKALLKDSLKEIKNTYKRFISILLMAFLGVGFFAGIRATSPDMVDTIDEYYDEQNVYDIQVISTLGLTNEDAEEISKIENVETVQGSYEKDGKIDIEGSEKVAKIISLGQLNQPLLLNGNLPQNEDECLVEETFLTANNKQIGDTIILDVEKTTTDDGEKNNYLNQEEVKIVGTIQSPLYISRDRGTSNLGAGKVNYYVYIPEENINAKDLYTSIYIQVKDAKKYTTSSDEYEEYIETVKADIENIKESREEARQNELIEKAQIEAMKQNILNIEKPTWYILDRNSNAGYVSFIQDTQSIENIGKVFPIVFFIVATLISLTSMTRMVEEQRMQLGTLKALGYSKFQITTKYIIYASLACIIGAVLGMCVGFILLPKVIWMMYGLMYQMTDISISFNLKYGAIGLILISICIIGATVYTVIKELINSPAILMRPKAPKSGNRVLLERLPFIWNRLNFSKKVTARNIFRYKKRFFMTVIGILGCTALILTGFGIKDSVMKIIPNQFDNVFMYDLQITLKENLADSEIDDFLDKILQKEEIEKVGKVYMTSGVVSNGETKEDVQIIVPYDEEELEGIINIKDINKEERVSLKENEICLTDKGAQLLDVKAGDTIILKDNDENEVQVKISNIVENYVGHYVFMSKQTYENLYSQIYKSNVILTKNIDLSSDEEDSLVSNIMNQNEVSSVTNISSLSRTIEDMMSLLNYVVIVLIVSAGLLAFVVLYNLANVNISERIRELATIKVLGFYDKEVYNYVAKETIILTVIGIILGLIGGYFLNYYIMGTCEINMLRFSKTINPISYVYAAGITILFTIIVNIATYFSLKKIDMIESLKSVE